MAKPKYTPPKKYPGAINGPGKNGLEGGTKFYDRMGRRLTAAGGTAPRSVRARFNLYNEALAGGAPVGTHFDEGALRGLRDDRKRTGGKEAQQTSAGFGNGGGGAGGGGGKNHHPNKANTPNKPFNDNGSEPYYEGDTTTTGASTVRANRLLGKGGYGAGLRGASGKGKPSDGKPGKGKRHKPPMRNVKGHQKSGAKTGYHLNANGDLVQNKGRQGK